MTRDLAQTLHASCVAWGSRAVVIVGPSGSGKSALALHLMAFGCALVADDQTEVWAQADRLFAKSPAALHGMIEARGVGILRAEPVPQAESALVVDLGQTETHRLPPLRHVTLLGQTRPLILGPLVQAPSHHHFPASILCYLKGPQPV